MPQLINVKYRGFNTSESVNQKADIIIGHNGVLYGFNVVPGNGKNISLVKGQDEKNLLIITGAEILETDDVLDCITISDNNSGLSRTDVVYARYIHGDNAICTYGIFENAEDVPDNSYCKLATITVPPGFNSSSECEILNVNKIETLFELTNRVKVYIGDQEPDTKNALWIDDGDEDTNEISSDIIEEIRQTLKQYNLTINDLKFVLQTRLDPGYFNGIDPNNPEKTPGSGAGTVGRIILKRGLKEDIESLQQGELGFCLDTEELYIGNGGGLRLLARVGGLSDGEGAGNLTGEYLELIANTGKKYRITVNGAGQLIVLDSDADSIDLPKPEEAGRFKGLFINKVYAGGAIDNNTTPCSHSFIELYNSTQNTINLRGLALQYGEYLGEWKMLPLRGEVKPNSSFLIRCARCNDPYRITTRFKILDFDMEWNIPLSDNGFKVYLNIPADLEKPTTYTNPWNIDGAKTKEQGYIDLFAAAGEDINRVIDGYAEGYNHIVNKNRLIKRKYTRSTNYAFSFTDDNSYDIEYVDLWTADIETYMPRSQKYGQWDFRYCEPKLDALSPNMLVVGFGENGDNTRTFTWQTPPSIKEGYLRYRKKSDNEWNYVESTTKFTTLDDTDVIIHSVIVRDLTPGEYVYQAGSEGRWSDEYKFKIFDPKNTSDPIRITWVTDQQGWSGVEYSAWAKAAKYIDRIEGANTDFVVNTGDMSQNANRAFEWRLYHNSAKRFIRNHEHICCVGNNDLVDKIDPIAFTYYMTCENSPYPSVYSFNYRFIHFIVLNSNLPSGNATVAQQIDFIRADMAKPENLKRWTIAIMHESPYTIIRKDQFLNYINVFNEVGVDLVLCGHHHCYTRSYRMGTVSKQTNVSAETVNNLPGTPIITKSTVDSTTGNTITTTLKKDESTPGITKYYTIIATTSASTGDTTYVVYTDNIVDNTSKKGTYYLMMQATGYKLSGKTAPANIAPWRALYDKPGDPCYGKFTINYDSIEFHAYRLINIMPLLDNVNKEVESIEFDSFVITKPSS